MTDDTNPLDGSWLHGLSPWQITKRTVRDFLDDDMPTYAAAQAFHIMLALFPFCAFLLALLGFLNLEGVFTYLIDSARTFLPEKVLSEVVNILEGVKAGDGGLLTVGILGAIWAASSGIRSTMNALNRAYNVDETRAFWKRYLLSIGYTVLVALLMIAGVALLMAGPIVADWLAGDRRFGSAIALAWTVLRYPIIIALLLVAASAVFYVAPNLDERLRFLTPGSMMAVLLWILTSLAFRVYLENFGRYGALYGSFATVVVLLLYLFLSAAVLLLGAEVNAVIRKHAKGGTLPAP